ncbi:hypothetical protein [Celeribacter persicus]|uniref:Uncharacterized protein n=1 Tax=Celeribacter persicus TaxID=1651082 RepID=A0A2T5H914_9RHOB|nr:hypothetical protein [Celeribacter persicus]PTQ68066.1 hypothetical protein C8N42_11681 [Celeribacter persicus]
MQQTTRDFWNDRYRDKTGDTSGKPGLVLSQFAGPLAPGRALERRCCRSAQKGGFTLRIHEVNQLA